MAEPPSGATSVAAAVGGAVLLGAGVAIAVVDPPPGWELDLYDALDGAPTWVDALLWIATAAGGFAVPLVLVAATGWRTRSVVAVGAAVVAGAAALLAAEILKQVVDRGRPCAFVEVPPCSDPGFPSSTTAVAFGVAVVVGAWFPAAWAAVALLLAAAVGLGRVVVGEHLPADVIGGAGAGLLVGAAVLAVVAARGSWGRAPAR